MVKTFSESYFRSRPSSTEPWVDQERPNHIDRQIQEWVEQERPWILEVQPLRALMDGEPLLQEHRMLQSVELLYVVLYEADRAEPEVREVREDKEEEELPEIPLKAGAVSPTVQAVRTLKKKRHNVSVMAGVFGVPEGDKLHPEDSEPAPAVVLAPGWNWPYGAELFGNVETKHE